MRKVGFVDLLDIKDPESKARTGAANGVFTFPFVTIENVDIVDADHIVVANDNNLPFFSAARSARTTTTSSSCCASPNCCGHDDAARVLPVSRYPPGERRLSSSEAPMAACRDSRTTNARLGARVAIGPAALERDLRPLAHRRNTVLACDVRATYDAFRALGMVAYIKPGFFTTRVFNPTVAFLAARLGLSIKGAQVLSVEGRKTGEWRSTQ